MRHRRPWSQRSVNAFYATVDTEDIKVEIQDDGEPDKEDGEKDKEEAEDAPNE